MWRVKEQMFDEENMKEFWPKICVLLEIRVILLLFTNKILSFYSRKKDINLHYILQFVTDIPSIPCLRFQQKLTINFADGCRCYPEILGRGRFKAIGKKVSTLGPRHNAHSQHSWNQWDIVSALVGSRGKIPEPSAILKYLKSEEVVKNRNHEITFVFLRNLYIQYEQGQQNLCNSLYLGTKFNLFKTHHATYKTVLYWYI